MRIHRSAVIALGRKIMGSRRERSERCTLRRFRSHFGTSPEICAEVWNALQGNPRIQNQIDSAYPEHLLWGLMLLKTYAVEEVLAGKVGVDEKMFCKLTKHLIYAIAYLCRDVICCEKHLNHGFGCYHISVDGTDCPVY